MPKFEYICEECGENFEITHHIEDPPPQVYCPLCYSTLVRRIYNPLPAIYVGSGFYKTDHSPENEPDQ